MYETLNMSSLWGLPHLIVCENNFYSQSTPQHLALAGDIDARARAFGIDVRQASVWDPPVWPTLSMRRSSRFAERAVRFF